jgi:hypothetical protein
MTTIAPQLLAAVLGGAGGATSAPKIAITSPPEDAFKPVLPPCPEALQRTANGFGYRDTSINELVTKLGDEIHAMSQRQH